MCAENANYFDVIKKLLYIIYWWRYIVQQGM